jgi:hypothetical protein
MCLKEDFVHLRVVRLGVITRQADVLMLKLLLENTKMTLQPLSMTFALLASHNPQMRVDGRTHLG